MKKIIALCLVILATSVSAFAFNGKLQDKKQNSSKRIEQLAKDLKLDEKQTKEFQKILVDSMNKLKKENESAGNDREKKRSNMKALITERDEQLKKVLTEEQYKQYKEKEKELKQRRSQGQRSGQRQGGGQK